MSRRRGIRRHESLQPLSRHHMVGLHLALKLRRAGTKKSRLTVEEIKEEVKEFWEPDGQRHFREEEEILLPEYSNYAPLNRPEIHEMLIEHVNIRALIQQIMNTKDINISLMHQLGTLLDDHIRKEERVIFPMIEKALPEDALERMAPYLHE